MNRRKEEQGGSELYRKISQEIAHARTMFNHEEPGSEVRAYWEGEIKALNRVREYLPDYFTVSGKTIFQNMNIV